MENQNDKKYVIGVISLLVCILLTYYCYKGYVAIRERGHKIVWQDKAVEQQLKKLTHGSGYIWSGDAKGRLFLTLEGKNIHSIQDLENFPNLRRLTLRGTSVTDLSPLEHLPKLEKLIIDGGEITNIEPLGKTSASFISLSDIPVTSIAALSTASQLSELELKNLDVTVLPPLKAGPLYSLSMENLPITDISPLIYSMGLEQFKMRDIQVSDVSVLEYLCNLQSICIIDCPVKRLPDLSNMGFSSSLPTSLKIKNTEITELSALPVTLGYLRLAGNQIKDFSKVNFTKNITHLEISSLPSDAEEFDLSVLEGCPNLRSLTLTNDHLKSIAGIDRFARLESLAISQNEIEDIDEIGRLDKLAALDISFNPVQDLGILENMGSLHSLSLSGIDLSAPQIQEELAQTELDQAILSDCNLDNVDFLSKSSELKELDISKNHIVNLAGLKGLEKMGTLNLSENPITDLTPLLSLKSLRKLNLSNIDLGSIEESKGNDILRSLNISDIQVQNCGLNTIGFINDWVQTIEASDNAITAEYLNELGAVETRFGLYHIPGSNIQIKLDRNQDFADYSGGAWM